MGNVVSILRRVRHAKWPSATTWMTCAAYALIALVVVCEVLVLIGVHPSRAVVCWLTAPPAASSLALLGTLVAGRVRRGSPPSVKHEGRSHSALTELAKVVQSWHQGVLDAARARSTRPLLILAAPALFAAVAFVPRPTRGDVVILVILLMALTFCAEVLRRIAVAVAEHLDVTALVIAAFAFVIWVGGLLYVSWFERLTVADPTAFFGVMAGIDATVLMVVAIFTRFPTQWLPPTSKARLTQVVAVVGMIAVGLVSAIVGLTLPAEQSTAVAILAATSVAPLFPALWCVVAGTHQSLLRDRDGAPHEHTPS